MDCKVAVDVKDVSFADASALCHIYNYYVKHSIATFQELPEELAHFQNIISHSQQFNLPFLVASLDNKIVGYCYLQPYNTKRSAYRFTTIDAIYIDHDYLGHGIGKQLLTELITRANALPCHSIIATVSLLNNHQSNASVALHQAMGFQVLGRMTEVGYKFNQWIDVVSLQRLLN